VGVDVLNSQAYGTDVAAIRQSLFYELNTSGKFHAFQEQMQRAVVKVVRERFRATSAIKDPVERQTFLATLYTFLIKEMHKTLNQSFAFSTSDLVVGACPAQSARPARASALRLVAPVP
jgi:hypothetical protein